MPAASCCSGDHTVKIVDAQSGKTTAVLDGHVRTPWVVGACALEHACSSAFLCTIVQRTRPFMIQRRCLAHSMQVRFNPANPSVVASGSLDHVVNFWDTNTGEKLKHHNFGRPIASIGFHPNGDILACASGRKVWNGVQKGQPCIKPCLDIVCGS